MQQNRRRKLHILLMLLSNNGTNASSLNHRYQKLNPVRKISQMHNLIDPYFWHTLTWFGIPIILILTWLRSGRSPLLWLSLGFAWLESVRVQFCRSCVVAYDAFKKD